MAKAERLNSGSYRCRATKTINGKKVTKSFTVSPNECGGDWKKAKKKAENMANNWILDAEADINGVLTVEDAIDKYNEARAKVLSPSTMADYYRMKKYFVKIHKVDIHDVTTDMIQNIIGDMALRTNRYGEPLDDMTIKNRIYYLLAVFGYHELNKTFKLRFTPKKEDPELSPPEQDEFIRILKLLESREDKLIIMLAALYTLRRGEICGLTGDDIIWDMHSIRIRHSMVKTPDHKWVLKPIPKTDQSFRTIELHPALMDLFPKDLGPKDLVITKNPDRCTKMFGRVRKKACVDCRLHDLRKYAASIRSDIMPAKYVEADGGWKKGSRVLSTIYDKPFKKSRREYSKKFNKMAVDDYGDLLLG